MNLHGVFHKNRVFDPTSIFEAIGKPLLQQKCLFDSDIVNYADVESLYRTTTEKNMSPLTDIGRDIL